MDFSIVIPVYKRINLLENCLNSVYEQILKPREIIIVDNNTSDRESQGLLNLINKFKNYENFNINIFKSP